MSDIGTKKDIVLTNQYTMEPLEVQKETNVAKLTIPELKKKIKYYRNPMEKKKLLQTLNVAYKEKKRRYCKDGQLG